MIKKSDLKKNDFMQFLTDEMLEKIIPITKVMEVESREIIFNEGDLAEHFYLVKSGQVLLEQKISKDILVNISAINAGEAFGLSVLLHRDQRAMAAICNEAATLIMIHRNDLLNLMEQDHTMGYLIMKYAAKVLHRRWIKRTEQFLRALKSHPDISALDVM
ncbi:MAG: cyclic nucleotide-binding domain-containing protein [Desulfamplus sp.]|nr:cyclic nucleotide-binding domain-containing protein [Desulfamplus sp.]